MKTPALLALCLLACDAGMTTTTQGARVTVDFFAQFSRVVLAAGTPEGADPTQLGPRVLVMGDSQVGHFGGALAQATSLRDDPWDLTLVSVSGSGVQNQSYWVPHIEARIAGSNPDLVVLNLGTNDANSPSFGEVWLELPAHALELLRSIPEDVPVVIVGTPPDLTPFGVPTPNQAAWLDASWGHALNARKLECPGFRSAFVLIPSGQLGADGVHYSALGGARVAELVAEAADQLLGEVMP